MVDDAVSNRNMTLTPTRYAISFWFCMDQRRSLHRQDRTPWRRLQPPH
jgi:hypothetical protein